MDFDQNNAVETNLAKELPMYMGPWIAIATSGGYLLYSMRDWFAGLLK